MKKITKTTSTRRRGKTTVKITKIIEEEVGTGSAPPVKAKAKSAKAAKATAPTPPPAPKKTIVRAHLLLDDSGSMNGCYRTAVAKVNEQLAKLKAESERTGIETYVTVWLFSDRVQKVVDGVPVGLVAKLTREFHCGGETRLIDAVCDAISDASMARDAASDDTVFLLMAATDGGENGSRWRQHQLKQLIEGVQRTGRWTLAFMVPRGDINETASHGIPRDNILEWDNTVAGAEKAYSTQAQAVSQYYSNVTRGVKSSTTFYATTDASKITAKDLAKLEDVTDRFQTLKVPHEVELQTFVEGKGKTFYFGAGYYPITKREKLRTGRDVLLRDKTTKRIYAGPQVRQLLGLDAGEGIVTPGNHANFDIFFQSTSHNRHLVNGTDLLWDKTQTADARVGKTWDPVAAQAAADAKKASATV